MTTTPRTKTLRLDATDLKWLSERVEALGEGTGQIEAASLRFDFLNHTFKIKCVDADDEGYDGRLVVELRVAG